MKTEGLYEAMLARDPRFDGKFFVGVNTTGIYCRPICPARPKRENVAFFPTHLAAERAGFRPCQRCRPEAAPLSPVWYGRSAVVQRALRVLSSEGLANASEDAFARQFGVSARHLRRLFLAEVGQTPKQIAMTQRLDFARKLVSESRLPLSTVAETSGFASVRRFNDAYKARFHKAPSTMRGGPSRPAEASQVHLTLAYRPPFDWASLLHYFDTHHLPGIERVANGGFERIFRLGTHTGWLRVEPIPGKHALRASVAADPSLLFGVAQRVRRMFDLDADPLLIANSFESEPLFARLVETYPGLRLARGWDPFETAIRTILGQLVSVQRGQDLADQLIRAYGETIRHPRTGEPTQLFPAPATLAASTLAAVGTTGQRKATIRELARRVTTGDLALDRPAESDAMKAALRSIPGIGPWSAEYIALRALGDSDAFPAKDLILARALEKHPEVTTDAVRPWRGYAAIYLWRHYAAELSKAKPTPKP